MKNLLPDTENFIITRSNNHSYGFDDKFYIIGEAQNEFRNNACVLIKYSHYKNILFDKPSQMFYFPVISTQPLSDLQQKLPLNSSGRASVVLKAKTCREEYLKTVSALKHHIQIGDIYEINFCVEFFAENTEIDPFFLFQELNSLSEAPYAALAKLGDDYIISASPELFLKKENEHLSTKPIKGTARRSANKQEDEYIKEQLAGNLKERTENVMIVDVCRNDLSVIAQKGSVAVDKLFDIETYKTVHQMVSTVSCKLKPGLNFNDTINNTFPMPSMTGAPKIRAMELIEEYENFERDNYSGALGIIKENGDYTTSVLIRSIFYNQKTKRLSFAVGSAITHLCDPEKEYEECLLKAGAMLKALNATIE